MGQEIDKTYFTNDDFVKFCEILKRETALLKKMFDDGAFHNDHGVGGFELEAWLVDDACQPTAINDKFLKALNDPLVCSELALFNLELNNIPHRLENKALTHMEKDVGALLDKCRKKAADFGAKLVMIGILPTVDSNDLVPGNMSDVKRYRALNDQIIARRRGNPVVIDIQGRERLLIKDFSVMIEAATTAFQIQFQVDFDRSVRFYNASLALSAPMVAVSANSPYMFGKDLWAESRIPIFEQSLSQYHGYGECEPNRVTFGLGYAKNSLYEIFEDNVKNFEVLLPMVSDAKPEEFAHLRLHSGTIWRWTRPLIGFNTDGSHHLRVEHRVAPAGPSLVDSIANAAFYYGLAEHYSSCESPLENDIPFADAKQNFYTSAKDGLDASLKWTNDKTVLVKELILKELLPAAHSGLEKLGLDKSEGERYLGIIEQRTKTGQNGAVWQRALVKKRNCGPQGLCEAYCELQQSSKPVHEWPV